MLKKNIIATLLVVLLINSNNFAQELRTDPPKYTAHNKGKFFVNWGGNRDYYSKSDIRFKGADYDFTLDNVAAVDKPKGWNIDYINPVRMTIPQTNFRLGYYFTDKYSISIGVDHMKYVMTANQTVNMNGNISLPAEDAGSVYNGIYANSPMVLSPDFLKFEHTDGLNYVNSEITRMDDITGILGWNTDIVQLNTVAGAGLGVLFPRTNTTLLGKERYDEFHVSGYGASVKAGLNLTFFKYFFIQSEIKGGHIRMSDIRTTLDPADRASQNFNFLQTNIVVGGIFRL